MKLLADLDQVIAILKIFLK